MQRSFLLSKLYPCSRYPLDVDLQSLLFFVFVFKEKIILSSTTLYFKMNHEPSIQSNNLMTI